MLFLGDIPPGYWEYWISMVVSIITVSVLLILGIKYLKKTRVVTNKSNMGVIYFCSCFFILSIPIFMFLIPPLVGGSGFGDHSGYFNTVIATLWVLGIFIAFYIVLIYLIHSKKKILEEVEKERKNNEI